MKKNGKKNLKKTNLNAFNNIIIGILLFFVLDCVDYKSLPDKPLNICRDSFFFLFILQFKLCLLSLNNSIYKDYFFS